MTPTYIALLLCAGICTVIADKTAQEPLSTESMITSAKAKFSEAVNTLENMTGVDIPSNQQEFKALLQSSTDTLKESALKFQKEISQWNSSSFGDAISKVKSTIDTTVQELGERNPDLGKLMTKVKTGFNNLTDVSRKFNDVAQEHASTAGENLKSIADQASVEVMKTAEKLVATFQEYTKEKSKAT